MKHDIYAPLIFILFFVFVALAVTWFASYENEADRHCSQAHGVRVRGESIKAQEVPNEN